MNTINTNAAQQPGTLSRQRQIESAPTPPQPSAEQFSVVQQESEQQAAAMQCPYCGAEVEAGADLCELCHHYIRKDICSFCGAPMDGSASFCAECGSPKAGIVCPVCHTLNEFSFCKQCGTPLTEEATKTLQHVKDMPEYREMSRIASDLLELDMQRVTTSSRDELRVSQADQLRRHVLELLAMDSGKPAPAQSVPPRALYSKEELQAVKAEKEQRLAQLLQQLAARPQPRHAQARTYALATKPRGIRLAWQCDWKHALHSSPCGCAKPNLGGKWVLLGRNSSTHDDK
ncbi:MAG: zinc ribbon domain-containing protein [Prevotella sp.]|nr:zinc ribbon domain-containing protein [Prevotella sp.]